MLERQKIALESTQSESQKEKLRVKRKNIIIFVVVFAVILLLVVGYFILSPLLNDDSNTIETTREGAMVEPEDIFVNGVGSQATDRFALEEGLAVFVFRHREEELGFTAYLLDDKGRDVETIADNEITGKGASWAVDIPRKGEYLLNVLAKGSWTVKIVQPRVFDDITKEQTFFMGAGSEAFFFKSGDGKKEFKLKHTGESNFIVWMLDKSGGYVDALANNIGNVEVTKTVDLDEGIYLLNVRGDGLWEIRVE